VNTVDAELEAGQTPVQAPGAELTEAREAHVGGLTVRRLLPLRLRRSVGAWADRRDGGGRGDRAAAGTAALPGHRTGAGRAVKAAAAAWREGRFGPVADYDGEPLAAPPLDPCGWSADGSAGALIRPARRPHQGRAAPARVTAAGAAPDC
jgi:hypothetical protein